MITKTKFKGLLIIQNKSNKDKRGYFKELINEKRLNERFPFTVISFSKKNVIRGLHIQTKNPQGKYLTVLRGCVFDVVVDLRKDSPTYSHWISVTLNPENGHSIHVPKGCANSFLTLKDETLVHYYSSQKYEPNYERGVNYLDPKFNFKWPHKPRVISDKDKSHKFF